MQTAIVSVASVIICNCCQDAQSIQKALQYYLWILIIGTLCSGVSVIISITDPYFFPLPKGSVLEYEALSWEWTLSSDPTYGGESSLADVIGFGTYLALVVTLILRIVIVSRWQTTARSASRCLLRRCYSAAETDMDHDDGGLCTGRMHRTTRNWTWRRAPYAHWQPTSVVQEVPAGVRWACGGCRCGPRYARIR